jgi:O-acetyl-ADP-ribose deacetylase (regulator of RNase III)
LCRDLDSFLCSPAAAAYAVPQTKVLTNFQRSAVALAKTVAVMPAASFLPTAANTDGAGWVESARQTLRAVFISMPAPLAVTLPPAVVAAHEALLQEEFRRADANGEVFDVERDFRPQLVVAGRGASAGAAYPVVVWRGDMSRLRVDAMVNPANAALMGCLLPAHRCLDNILHAQAGIRLRAECHAMFAREGIDPIRGDGNGRCRVTSACALPAKWVLHTIGPNLHETGQGRHRLRTPTDSDRAELASCYRECYRAAVRLNARSIAFCCISTGVFGYPQAEAARIALETIKSELDAAAGTGAEAACRPLVVFNVFTPDDLATYRDLAEEVFPRGTVPMLGQ